ncbi:MAG TPA: hypothetical protein VN238_22795 [Solirubrobacteraceae bacterium]|nr:hypothetical protein [Solirubrobacteraceae bacterium]
MSRETVRLLVVLAFAIVVLAVALVIQAVTDSAVASVAGAVAAFVVLFLAAEPPFGPRR